jgi:hypothetical protein
MGRWRRVAAIQQRSSLADDDTGRHRDHRAAQYPADQVAGASRPAPGAPRVRVTPRHRVGHHADDAAQQRDNCEGAEQARMEARVAQWLRPSRVAIRRVLYEIGHATARFGVVERRQH